MEELTLKIESFCCNPPLESWWLVLNVTGDGVPAGPGGPGGPGGPCGPLGPVAKFTIETVVNGELPFTDGVNLDEKDTSPLPTCALAVKFTFAQMLFPKLKLLATPL
jgi:hypothetical protein